MALFQKIKEKRENRKRLLSLEHQLIKYTTRLDSGNEIVLGRNGSIAIMDEKIYIHSSNETVFIGALDTTTSTFHISGDGAILEGLNLVNQKQETIIAYFVNHIK